MAKNLVRHSKMARVAPREYTPDVKLSDLLLIPAHRIVSGLITWNDSITRGVERRLPEAVLRAANKAKVQIHISEEALRHPSSLMSSPSIVPAGRDELGKRENVLASTYTGLEMADSLQRYLLQKAKRWATPNMAAEASEEVRAVALVLR